MMGSTVKRSHTAYDLLKRIADVVVSAVALVVLSPVFAVVALLVRIKLGSPVIFRQQRPGKDGRLFTLYKFRTMLDAAPNASVPATAGAAPGPVAADAAVATDGARLTPFGRGLRSTSLDELPELVNVLKGDMSIVGPRPLLPEYLDRYNSEQARRHEVRPGITGWAQVNGRNAVSWDERFKMDVWYVDHRSFALDARILFMTVAAVLSREGVSAPGAETMRPFEGDAGTAEPPRTKES
jgi:lipopolysaccharide/colanic/teichoic acid biosynthesis glycosyltransferase